VNGRVVGMAVLDMVRVGELVYGGDGGAAVRETVRDDERVKGRVVGIAVRERVTVGERERLTEVVRVTE